AFNLGRMGLLVAGLGDGRLLVPEATADRLHQNQRSKLFPEAPRLLEGLVVKGALASCWSGAGPSLLAICDRGSAAQVRDAADGRPRAPVRSAARRSTACSAARRPDRLLASAACPRVPPVNWRRYPIRIPGGTTRCVARRPSSRASAPSPDSPISPRCASPT